MAGLIIMIGVGIIGIIYLIRGEFKFTKNKVVDAKTGRVLGLVMIAGVILDFIAGGAFFLSLLFSLL